MKKTTSLGLALLLISGVVGCKSKVKETPATPAQQKKEFSKSLPTYTQSEFDQDKQNLEVARVQLAQSTENTTEENSAESHEVKIQKYDAIIKAYNTLLEKYSSKFRFENDEDGKYRFLTISTEELTKQRDAFVALKTLAIKLRDQSIVDNNENINNETEEEIIIEEDIPTHNEIVVTHPKYDYYEVVKELEEIEKKNIALRAEIVSLGQSVHKRERETDLRAFTQAQDEKIITETLERINFLNSQNRKYESQKDSEIKKIEEERWTISSWATYVGYDSLSDDKQVVADKYNGKIERNNNEISSLQEKAKKAQERFNKSVAYVADTANDANKKITLEEEIAKNLERAVELRLILESGEFHVGQKTEISLEEFQKEVEITRSILESLPATGTQFKKQRIQLSNQSLNNTSISCFIQVDSIEEIEKLDMLTGTITVKTLIKNVKLTEESAQGCVHDTEMIDQSYSTEYHFSDIINKKENLDELINNSEKTVKILKESNRRYKVVSIQATENKESITEVNLLESMVHDFFITNKEVRVNGVTVELQKVERVLE
ncbi:MAG: hypothetical protein GY909_16900 [Oligoflexia bacterium]|nr:hypothetical protein [Oligoflexia bacterium]